MVNIFEKFFSNTVPEQPELSLKVLQKDYGASPDEDILGCGEKKTSKVLGRGANNPEFIEIKDDGAGIFKARSKEVELRENIPKGTYYKRERAAYLVSRFLNFDLVPPTVLRDIDGEIGSLQRFVPDATTGAEMTWTEDAELLYRPEKVKMQLFDYLIYNADRNRSNFLCKEGKIIAIDNGLAFGNSYLDLHDPGLMGQDIPENTKAAFRRSLALSEDGASVLNAALLELLPANEVNAFFKRLEKAKTFIAMGRMGYDLKFS